MRTIIILCILALLLTGCSGGGELSTVTPVPPAARSGSEAINALRAEGMKCDPSKLAVWERCP